MTATCIRAVLNVKDLPAMSSFYQTLFNARVLHSDADHAALQLGGFKLFLHRLPAFAAGHTSISTPPVPREQAPLKLWFSVSSIEDARKIALANGGHIDGAPPPWVIDKQSIATGYDPEGNVFQLIEEQIC